VQKFGKPEILCYLQKFQGKFYVLAALSNCVLSRRFGNPLRKFFCGFGFVEFLMRSAPLPKGDWGWSACVFGVKGDFQLIMSVHICLD
jgi:hypothetical protein